MNGPYWRDDNDRLNCRHGVILYGTSCIQCERESRHADNVPPAPGVPTFHGQPYNPGAIAYPGCTTRDQARRMAIFASPFGAACDEAAAGYSYRPHPADVLADQVRATGRQCDLRELAHIRLVCDEQVGNTGEATGMWSYPQVVPPAIMTLIAGFCVGVTQRSVNQYIGRNGNPYIDRWFLARKSHVPAVIEEYAAMGVDVESQEWLPSEIENIYLHGYHRGDADEPHDHPWPNVSLVVRGWYREAIYDDQARLLGEAVRRPGDIVLRRATSVHAILETSDDCLSLFATLRKERDWGFHTAAGFVPWREFTTGNKD